MRVQVLEATRWGAEVLPCCAHHVFSRLCNALLLQVHAGYSDLVPPGRRAARVYVPTTLHALRSTLHATLTVTLNGVAWPYQVPSPGRPLSLWPLRRVASARQCYGEHGPLIPPVNSGRVPQFPFSADPQTHRIATQSPLGELALPADQPEYMMS